MYPTTGALKRSPLGGWSVPNVWVAITQEEGEFVAAFNSPENAFQYYGAEFRKNSYSGMLHALTGIGDEQSFAYRAMTKAEAADLFGEDALEEVQAPEPGYHIMLWNPFEGSHTHLLLRCAEIH